MDFYFTRLPLLNGLILRTPSSALRGFPVCRPKILVGLEFPAFVVVSMLLLAAGAFRKRLTGLVGLLGFGSGGGLNEETREEPHLCRDQPGSGTPPGDQGRSSSATTGSREPGSAISRLCQKTGNGLLGPTGSTASQPGNTVRSVGQ